MLLAQSIQFAVAGLLEFAVALALFRQLQLQRLTVAPELIQWANLCRDLGTSRINARDQLAALIRRNFGVGEQNPLFKGILPPAVVILAGLLTRLRRH